MRLISENTFDIIAERNFNVKSNFIGKYNVIG